MYYGYGCFEKYETATMFFLKKTFSRYMYNCNVPLKSSERYEFYIGESGRPINIRLKNAL